MTTDFYTKIVLTVIAISLASIAFQHAIPSAFAQSNSEPIRVLICDYKHPQINNCASVEGNKLRVYDPD